MVVSWWGPGAYSGEWQVSFDELSWRELDAAVAARVFGFVVEPRKNARTREKDFVQLVRSDSPHPQWVRVALCSENMGAALNIEMALRERGWTRTGPQGRCR